MPPKRYRKTLGTTQTIKLERSFKVHAQNPGADDSTAQLLINMNGNPFGSEGAADGLTDTGFLFFNPAGDSGQTTGNWQRRALHKPGTAVIGTTEVWEQNDLINRKRCYMVKVTYTPHYSDIVLQLHSASITTSEISYRQPGFIVYAKRAVELSANVIAGQDFERLRTTRLPLKYLKWNKKFKTVMKCPQSTFRDRVFQVAVAETRRYNCGQWSSDDQTDNMTPYTGEPGQMGPQHGYGGHILIQFPQIIDPMVSLQLGTVRITAYFKGFLDQ